MNEITAISIVLCVGCVAFAAEPDLIFPRALPAGGTIAIVAPSSDLNKEKMEWAIDKLRGKGFHVKVPSTLYRRRGYLAGTDAERADEVMAAFLDNDVDAVFCGGGGYGATRMLDRLDYDAIRKHPKILTGFSDVTGLHLAIHRKSRLVTIHSPFLGPVLEARENPFTGDYFWRAILLDRFISGGGRDSGYLYVPPSDSPAVATISPGVARGRIIGGNLSLISATMGTPYEIETKGRILFIEDWHEEPYRVDRYLSQLRLAGKLDGVAGVIIGAFIECDAKEPKNSLTLDQVFEDYFKQIGVPVISNFPVGHFKYNAAMPLGVMAELNADRRQLRLLENPVLTDISSSTATPTSNTVP